MGDKKEDKVTVKTGPSIGIFGLMFLIFMVLKLTGHIGWSWFWVTAPLWMPISFMVLILLIIFVAFIIKS